MRVFAVISLLFGLIGLSAAQTCAGAGYDVSAAAIDMSVVSSGYTWYLHPCGSVSTSVNPNCTAHTPGAMLCQTSGTSVYVASVYNASVASAVQWVALPNGNGVQYSIQDGDSCGAFNRETTVQFVCNTTATTPWFQSVTEVETCWYTAVVHTSAACTATGNTGSHAVGSSFYDTVCGGSVYDLTAIHNYGDIRLDTNTSSVTNGYYYYINMCGQVQNGNCSSLQPTSFCQTGKPSGAIASLANINSTTLALYTVNSDGVTLAIQDGTPCGGVPRRQASIRVICDGTNPPALTAVTEVETCHYSAQLHATCSLIAGSSSTGSAAAGSSSSGAVTSSGTTASTGAATSSGSSPQPPPANGASTPTVSLTLMVLITALVSLML